MRHAARLCWRSCLCRRQGLFVEEAVNCWKPRCKGGQGRVALECSAIPKLEQLWGGLRAGTAGAAPGKSDLQSGL